MAYKNGADTCLAHVVPPWEGLPTRRSAGVLAGELKHRPGACPIANPNPTIP